MNKLKIFLLTAVSMFVLSGCLVLGPKGVLGELPSVGSIDNSAEVYLIREKHFVGCGLSYKIVLDEKDLMGIRSGQYTKFNIDPGKHSITVKSFGGIAPVPQKETVEKDMVTRGKYYFVINPDAIKCVDIKEIDEEKAQKLIPKSKFVDLTQKNIK